jgi:hypothetical protein
VVAVSLVQGAQVASLIAEIRSAAGGA